MLLGGGRHGTRNVDREEVPRHQNCIEILILGEFQGLLVIEATYTNSIFLWLATFFPEKNIRNTTLKRSKNIHYSHPGCHSFAFRDSV